MRRYIGVAKDRGLCRLSRPDGKSALVSRSTRTACGRHAKCTFVEFFTDDQVLNFRRLISNQLELDQGRVLLRQSPGLGFDFDEQAVRRYGGQWSVIA